VANGIIEATRQVGIKVPVVVRLEGTNAKEAREILGKSGLNFAVADSFQSAAEKVTSAIHA
jgi:succinyl-CoA synthetase beta subunit